MSVTKKLIYLDNQTLAPAHTPGAAAGNGLALDRRNNDTAIFNLAVATMTSATAAITIQHSDAEATGFTNFQIDGSDVVSESLDTTNTNTSLTVDLSGAKRYIRAVSATTGTVSAFSVTALLADGQYSNDWERSTQYGGDQSV